MDRRTSWVRPWRMFGRTRELAGGAVDVADVGGAEAAALEAGGELRGDARPEVRVGFDECVDLAAGQLPALLGELGQRFKRRTREAAPQLLVGEEAAQQDFDIAL